MAGVGLEVLESVTEDVERVSSPREGSDSVRVQGLERLEVGGTGSERWSASGPRQRTR